MHLKFGLAALYCVVAIPSAMASRGIRLAAHSAGAVSAEGAVHGNDQKETCGPLSQYAHARPQNYKDGRKTKYDAEAKKTVDVTFVAGDSIAFECVPGYTTDGAKDGPRDFTVECSTMGYFKPSAVCLEALKCGALPDISHAAPTGKVGKGHVQFACSPGYSLDGHKVTPGGLGKNSHFDITCVEFSGQYEPFTGACKPYAFVPSTETARIYNKVSEALFVVSCKGTLKEAFGASGAPPEGLDAACSKIQDSAKQGECQGLVSKVKSDFETKKGDRETHDEKAKKEWFEEKAKDRPGVSDEATEFCSKLWKLLEFSPS